MTSNQAVILGTLKFMLNISPILVPVVLALIIGTWEEIKREML